MGKLHKIRRAFDKLSHNRKMEMHSSLSRFGCVYSMGYWQFTPCPYYRCYVTKLINRYYNKHTVENRHVFERAYLNGEKWAVEEFDRLYR